MKMELMTDIFGQFDKKRALFISVGFVEGRKCVIL